jgi:Ca2+-binding RTX toxin-like protein
VTGGSGNDTLIGGAGADTITNSGGASDSVDGGDGNDSVVATLTAGNTIVGGAGTDTLSIAVAATAATATGVSGFETLTDTAGVSQSMSLFLDNNTFTKVVAANTNTTAITGATGTLTALDVTAAGTTTFARLVDSSANALTVTVTGGVTATAITASDEETITLASSNSTATTVTALTATDLQTLNITGSGAVTITTLNANSTASSSATFVVNGSTNSAGINVSAANSTIVANMTGSSTASSTLVGSAGSDTITGGAAADSITGGVGYDTLTGGAGADSFLFANSATGTPSATGNAFDIIADYQSGIDIIEAGTVFGTAAGAITLLESPNTTHAGGVAQAGKAWVASGVVSFHISDNTLALRLIAVENAIADLNADGTAADAAAGDTLVFGFGSDSYIFISDATAGVGTTDVLVRLTGIAASSSTDSLTIANGNITALT